MFSPTGAILPASTRSTDKNIHHPAIILFTSIIAACWACGTYAADKSPDTNAHEKAEKIKMDEPMTSEMMKQGMMKGDVKRAAERKAKEMQPMMKQEEKSMPMDKARQ